MSGKIDLSALKDKVSSKLKVSSSKKANKKSLKTEKVEVKQDDKKPSEKEEVLRREALALGASEKDLELVQGLSDIDDDEKSEQEFGDDGEEDDDFKDDLQKFMKNIGFDKKIVQEDLSEEEPEQPQKEKPEQQEDAVAEDQEESLSSDSESEKEVFEKQEESANEDEQTQKTKNKDLVSDIHMVKSDKLIIPNDAVWYNIPLKINTQDSSRDYIKLTNDQSTSLLEKGKQALDEDNQTYYDEFTKDSSQRKFMSQILSDGTLSDKISALTLLVQESPLHNIKSLETLIGYCNKKSRNSILQSLNALKDLFLNGLLPDRKLRYFKNQPGLSMSLDKKTLAIFYFEDYLKKSFFTILEVLEKLTHDPIIHVRMQVLNHLFDFVTAKPEQEFNLLRLGVNKLGDIDSKVSSKTSYLLLKLQQAHPNMKSVIIDSIVDISLRPNADYHATYYSVITLNQTILKRSEDDVANKLVKTYFTLFEKFLMNTDKDNAEDDGQVKTDTKSYENKRKKNFKKGKNGGKSVKNEKTEEELVSERNSKLFSALLTGVNRAFPFAHLPAAVYEPHLDTLFKITHSSNFNTSIQALILINQVVVKAGINSDRYYRTLYESLLDPRLVNSSKQGIYINLLYKSLKQDSDNIERVEAFVKRILQICLHWINIGTIAGFFFLLLQLIKTYPQIKNLLTNTPVDHEYASDEEEDTENKTSKHKVYDSRKRDPRFANADKSSMWEITQFLNHFHPTVQTYANALINSEESEEAVAKPDLGLYTLTHFLDRFVYRNAKQKNVTRGTSIMQPLFGGSQINSSILVKASDIRANEVPVNTENWLNKKINDIKPDEKFFYQYFSTKQNAIKKVNKNETRGFDDVESDLDEEEVWDALVKSRPDVEDDSENDGFGSMSDYSDSDDSDANEDANEEDNSDEAQVFEDELSEGEVAAFDDMFANGGEDEANNSADDDSADDQFFSFRDENGDELSSSDDEPAQQPEEDEKAQKPSSAKKRSNEEYPEEARKAKNKLKKQKRKEIKNLPLFASADDYSKYLQSDEE